MSDVAFVSRVLDRGPASTNEILRASLDGRDLAAILRPRIALAPNGCWVWVGSRRGDGYGRIALGSRVRGTRREYRAHRLVYEHVHGAIPAGFQLDHLCRTPACVNPEHLEAVEPRTNTLRGIAPTAINAAKAACKNGHPFDAVNTYIARNRNGRPARICRRCAAEWQRCYRAKKLADRQLELAS